LPSLSNSPFWRIFLTISSMAALEGAHINIFSGFFMLLISFLLTVIYRSVSLEFSKVIIYEYMLLVLISKWSLQSLNCYWCNQGLSFFSFVIWSLFSDFVIFLILLYSFESCCFCYLLTSSADNNTDSVPNTVVVLPVPGGPWIRVTPSFLRVSYMAFN
jgi:hypothetical protein